MRILLTTDTIGGVWTFTRELTREFLQQGHHVALVSFGRAPAAEQTDWCKDIARAYPGEFHYRASSVALEWMKDNHRAYDEGAYFLLRAVRDFAPDLVHSNQFCFGSLPVDVPVVITAHSDVLSWGEACRPEGFKTCSWLKQYVTLVQRGLADCSALTAPSAWMLKALIMNFDVEGPTRIIPNGRALPAARALGQRKVQAITVGRLWDEGKNLQILTRMRSPVPIVVGGEQEYEDAESPDVSANAEFLGMLSERELQRQCSMSSIYLSTSIYEPFGLAPLEAALCGCAIVANDIPSMREVWEDGALYFNDGPSLLSLLGALKNSPTMLSAARRRSYQRAQEFSARKMADAYLALYRTLIDDCTEAFPCELASHAQ